MYEKELLAILFGVIHRYFYLSAHHVVISTHQQSIKNLLEKKISTPLQHTWLEKFLGFDYKIMYWAGKENVADGSFQKKHEFQPS